MSEKLYLTDNGFVNTKAEATPIRNQEMVEMVEGWLRENSIPSSRKYKYSSYRLKHDAEAELHTYISNGAFIQACMNLGYRVERIEGGLNGYIYADFIGINPIKKACKSLGLTYKELGDRIGYGEEAISKAARSEEISRPMAAALDLLLENESLRAESKTLDDIKSVLTRVLSRK